MVQMKKLVFLILIPASIRSMNSDEQVQNNAAQIQEILSTIQSPTYFELLLRQRGVPQEKIPSLVQKFFYSEPQQAKTPKKN